MNFIGKTLDQFIKQLKAIKPFSWQVSLLLSLFSWCTYLLIRDPAVKQFVSLFGWFFLIVGTDWALMKREVTIPGLSLKFKYGPWLTGALASCAFWSNRFIIQDAQGAFVSWPLFSVLFAAFPKFLKTGPTFKTPDVEARKDLVILALLGMLFACWFRFHFLLQDFLKDYPNLAADNVGRSAFVVRFNSANVPVSSGVAVLDASEAIARNELNKRSWADGQRWLVAVSSNASLLGTQALTEAYKAVPNAEEAEFWRVNAQVAPGVPTNLLQLQAVWTGPSSNPDGYVLQKSCAISQAPIQQFVEGAALPTAPALYRMDCGPIASSAPGINTQPSATLQEQAGDFLSQLWGVIVRAVQGLIDFFGSLLGVGRDS